MIRTIRRDALARGARDALDKAEGSLADAYCPHSGLSVAACLVTGETAGVCGVNYESDSYGLTLCAERAAIARAQVEGTIGDATAIVLVARAAPGVQVAMPLLPCGACRQWLAELSRRLDRNLEVISFAQDGEAGITTWALDLLPADFNLKEMNKGDHHP